MATVVYLVDRRPIIPKTVSGNDHGHRYSATFDPNAPIGQQWVWTIHYTRVYTFYGSSPSQADAIKSARKKIHRITNHIFTEEEDE
jgi:hypothetical protein